MYKRWWLQLPPYCPAGPAEELERAAAAEVAGVVLPRALLRLRFAELVLPARAGAAAPDGLASEPRLDVGVAADARADLPTASAERAIASRLSSSSSVPSALHDVSLMGMPATDER